MLLRARTKRLFIEIFKRNIMRIKKEYFLAVGQKIFWQIFSLYKTKCPETL